MHEQQFSGSCLCGEIAYDIRGEVQAFYHCHCSRCRKATGTGHASNVIIRYSKQDWIRGESLLQRFDVPGAKRFFSMFCSKCGSPMPRIVKEQNIAVIAAGSLDNNPELSVTARIFQDSRANWSCHGDSLAHWDQYPEKG